MASKFSPAEDTCEGDDCEAITDVTYYVKEKKKLCEGCASKEGCIGKARKGGPTLYCDIHDEDIKLYCKTHGVALCYSCAIIDHQQPCVQQDIEGAIMENREKLKGLKDKAMDKIQLCRAYGDQIRQCRQDTDTHLQALQKEVDLVINEAIKTDKDREQEDAAKINQEVDEKNQKLQEEIQKITEKMQKNNEEREERLELNNKNAEARRIPMNNKQRVLHSDIEFITEVTEKKIDESEKSWKDDTKTAKNTVQTLDTVIKDDRNVVKDGHRVNVSVTDELEKGLDVDGVKHITRTVSGVRFVNGVGREKYDGRIDGYDGEWRLIDTIKDEIKNPFHVVLVGEDKVIIRYLLLKDDTHTSRLALNNQLTQRMITSDFAPGAMYCALLNDDNIVVFKKLFTL